MRLSSRRARKLSEIFSCHGPNKNLSKLVETMTAAIGSQNVHSVKRRAIKYLQAAV